MYAIQDVETGNYLSEFSFQQIDEVKNRWMYITYTGKLGTRFYAKEENAEWVLNRLELYNRETGANRILKITEANEDSLLLGNRVIQYIN